MADHHKWINTLCVVICAIAAVVALPATLYCGYVAWKGQHQQNAAPVGAVAMNVHPLLYDVAFAIVLICCALLCCAAITLTGKWIWGRMRHKQAVVDAPMPHADHTPHDRVTPRITDTLSIYPVPTETLLSPLQVDILALSRDLRAFLQEINPAPELLNTGPIKQGRIARRG
jgi:hypothetical protein